MVAHELVNQKIFFFFCVCDVGLGFSVHDSKLISAMQVDGTVAVLWQRLLLSCNPQIFHSGLLFKLKLFPGVHCVGLARSASFGTTSLQPGSGPSAFDFVSASPFLLVPTTQVFTIIPDADGGLVAVVF